MRDGKPENDVERFITKQKILIADTSKSSRVGIARALCEMGAVSTQMILVDSYAWAEESIRSQDPGIVVMDYQLESFCGLDLLQREDHSDQRVVVVVTSNNSQAAVARAAEGDVDAYITKPYTLKIFNKSVAEAVLRKLNPTEYVTTINRGRRLLDSERERAKAEFKKAMGLSERPALACFYFGLTHQRESVFDIAQANYTQGLEYNHLHFKCLIGLHETFHAQDRILESYGVLKRMFRHFPLNPGRFISILKLAVQNAQYDDIGDYYDAFLQLEIKNDEVVKHVCAALIIAGKYFLKQGDPKKALALFQKAAVSAAGRIMFLREIILALADNGLALEMDPILKRWPQDLRGTLEFRSLDYLSVSLIQPLGLVVKQGRKLLQDGHHDPLIYKILIKASVKASLAASAEELAVEATKRWPEKKSEFISG
jgi:DNA-binding response OmpR family regulator